MMIAWMVTTLEALPSLGMSSQHPLVRTKKPRMSHPGLVALSYDKAVDTLRWVIPGLQR